MRSKIWSNTAYYLVYGVTYLLSLLPLRVHYFLSDGIYLFIYYIIRYRRPLVRKNLMTSFPEKSETEIRNIERQFYHWLCDYFAETLKLLSISDKALMRHLRFGASTK